MIVLSFAVGLCAGILLGITIEKVTQRWAP
jgi:hypothetical protein